MRVHLEPPQPLKPQVVITMSYVEAVNLRTVLNGERGPREASFIELFRCLDDAVRELSP